MTQLARPIAVALAAILAWTLLGQLVFLGNVGDEPALSARRALAYLLLLAAPALTFVPLARWARAPFYDLEAVTGWSLVGFVLVFVTPADPPTLAQFLVFLLPLTVALATALAFVAYLAGLRVYRGDPRRRDFVRARRQGYLAALSLIALALLYGVGTLSPTSALLVLLVGGLAEWFALSHDARRGRQAARRG
jgi:hypothetical protein